MMRRTQLVRTEFKRKPDAVQLTRGKGIASSKAPMKTRRRKPTVAEGSKYLAACRGESCYLRVPGVCSRRADDATVVPCHSNQAKHGKGMGLKAAHQFTVPGCMSCHSWLDQGGADRETKVLVFDTALDLWVEVRDRKMSNPQQISGA